MQGKIFEGDYKTRCKNIDSLLCVGDTFDMLKREIRLGDRHAVFYMIDGFLKGEVLEKIMEFFCHLHRKMFRKPMKIFEKMYAVWRYCDGDNRTGFFALCAVGSDRICRRGV